MRQGRVDGGAGMALKMARDHGRLAGSGIVKALCALAWATVAAIASPAMAGPTPPNPCLDGGHPVACNISMTNFGGPTMTGTTNIYNIWYGDWGGSTAIDTMAGLFSGLTGTEYLNLGAYYGVSTDIAFQGTTLLSDYLGDNLSDADLATIVKDFTNPANPKGGPARNNAIYFIFTGRNVREQSDLEACGFHSDTGGLKYAWVSGSMASALGCGSSARTTDNISAVATAQLFNTLTDPMVNEAAGYGPPLGWYDGGPNPQGEVADPCAFHQDTLNEGGGMTYTVQQIFVNNAMLGTSYPGGGACLSAHFPNPDGTPFTPPSTPPAGVPEPADWVLLIVGFGACGGALRRRAKLAA